MTAFMACVVIPSLVLGLAFYSIGLFFHKVQLSVWHYLDWCSPVLLLFAFLATPKIWNAYRERRRSESARNKRSLG